MAKYTLKRKTYSVGDSFTNIKQGVSNTIDKLKTQGVTDTINNLKGRGNKAVQNVATAWKNTGNLGKAGAITGAAIGTGLLAKSIFGRDKKKKSTPQQPA